MIHIKTQNIPLETFSSIKHTKKTPNGSGNDFSRALETLLKKEPNNANLKIKGRIEDIKDTDDLESSEQGISWFMSIQWPEDLKDPSITFDEMTFSSALNGEITSINGLPTETLQMNHSDESLSNTLERLTSEITNSVTSQAAEEVRLDLISEDTPLAKQELNETHIFQNVGLEQSVTEQLSTIKNQLKEIPFESNQQASVAREMTNDVKEILGHLIKTDERTDQSIFKQSIASSEEFPVVSEQNSDGLPQKNSADPIHLINETSETNSVKLRPIEEQVIQEDSTKAMRVDEMELDQSIEESKNPHFERGVEQLRNLRLIQPKEQAPKKMEISENEWVSEIESLVVEQNDTARDLTKSSTARIQLTPKHLGEMEIELVIKENGLKAKIRVGHSETKEWLEQKVAELTSKLALKNIEVEDFQVTVVRQDDSFIGTGVQDQSFFQENEQDDQAKSPLDFAPKEEQESTVNEQKYDVTNGRISLWV